MNSYVILQAVSTCPGYPITNYNVTLTNSSGGMVTSPYHLPPNETEVNFGSADGLRMDAFYHVHVTAINSIGSDSSELGFSEYKHAIYIVHCTI